MTDSGETPQPRGWRILQHDIEIYFHLIIQVKERTKKNEIMKDQRIHDQMGNEDYGPQVIVDRILFVYPSSTRQLKSELVVAPVQPKT